MCGFAGVRSTGRSSAELGPLVEAMGSTLVHRGPDDAGLWCDPDVGYAVAFRRLAVVDLSAAGHQPMGSPSGRYVIAFNGEVYNAPELREVLRQDGHAGALRGHSDTEVMLCAIEAWGLDVALDRFIGMFAFALWDRVTGRLCLVRDRLGVKPLYYGWIDGGLAFASELTAFRAHPRFDSCIDRAALALFFRHNYVPAPLSIFRDVRKVRPGYLVSVDPAGRIDERQYWSADQHFTDGQARVLDVSDSEAVERLDALLRDSIRMRMQADVPVGVFLSGGIDSTLVAAMAQAQSARSVRSFSIGFDAAGYDESVHAAEVARHLGLEHLDMRVTDRHAIETVPRLPRIYDEPFADSSQVGTFLVCSMAREHVTVALSGDGGDELFGGYDRYRWIGELWRRLGAAPRLLRRGFASTVSWLGPDRISATFAAVAPPSWRARMRNPARQLERLASIAASAQLSDAYRSLVAHVANPCEVVIGCSEDSVTMADPWGWVELRDVETQSMLADIRGYLPDDILVKVDRASMAVSLEAREPLLDHRLVEFSARLPLRLKMRGHEGKWALRRVLDRYVPRGLVDRPKSGFSTPIGEWLRGPLRGWAEELLSERALRQDGLLDPTVVRGLWQQHLDGRSFGHVLWNALMFQGWLRHSPLERAGGASRSSSVLAGRSEHDGAPAAC